MKKSKLFFPSLFLAMTLFFVSAGSVSAYAANDDPQGGSKSTNAPAPPVPPALVDIIIAILMWL